MHLADQFVGWYGDSAGSMLTIRRRTLSMTMFSPQFLTFYCFFKAAVAAYQSTPEDARNSLEGKTVADAFNKAIAGCSKKDQTALLQFLLRLIQQPEEFNQNRYHREKIESALDREIATQFREIVKDEHLIIEADFLARAGITKEDLLRKLRERRIFSIPQWIHKEEGDEYYPAFFVDSQYDISLLETVSMTLRALSGARKYRFFTSPALELEGKTPLEVLSSGKLESVVNAAKALLKRTAM